MPYALIAALLMALVTYLPRVLPIAVFRKEIKSTYIKSFLRYVPYAVLGALTFPDIFSSTNNYGTAICGTVVALILAYMEKKPFYSGIGSNIDVYVTGLFL